jgi:hypothetical protein
MIAGQSDPLLNTATEILKLLRLMAEPELAQVDKEPRAALKQIVGKSPAKAQAIQLMDGSRTQTEIRQLVKIDAGDLSKMVKALREAQLLSSTDKPAITIYIPPKFFSSEEGK